ncbi:hypothetical protein DFQ26_001143 [Actinomortierella ambigua]|nr:hypothetical protein DFQ26_001143 [Actinomortierella ambigua]
MIHRLSVLATLLLSAILQVCTAFKPPTGAFRLSFRGMGLDVESHLPGSRAILDPKGRFAVWELTRRGAIIEAGSGLFLGYDSEDKDARLILTMEPIKWEVVPCEQGLFEIRVRDSDLVIGTLPLDLARIKQGKEGSLTWMLQPVPHELNPTPDVPEGNFQLELNGLFLGVRWPESSQHVHLLRDQPRSTIWMLMEEDPPGTVSIQNLRTGLYLSYNPSRLDDPLQVTTSKSLFRLETIWRDYMRIIAVPDGATERAVARLPPRAPGPPMVGLVEISKDPTDPAQVWKPRFVRGLDDSPRQYRLPFHRLRFW